MALQHRLALDRELSPEATAATVAGVLPPRHGVRLMRWLARRGWLDAGAVIPFDLLDSRGPRTSDTVWRAIVRLAVFGPPGQGIAWRDRHRHDVYLQLCAEIMRAAVDSASLELAASRAMGHQDVGRDPLLSSMLQSFIAERRSALHAARSTPAEDNAREANRSKLQSGFGAAGPDGFPSRQDIVESFSRLQREFDSCLAQFEEARAIRVLDRLRGLRQKFPVHIAAADLQRCEEQYDRLLKRAAAYRRQIEELAAQAAAAALAGDEKTATWVIRRLEAIHMLLPNLLSLERVGTLRASIRQSERQHEHDEAARELRRREQEVADRIRNLAGIIHRFHQIAAKLSPADNAYRRAELNYKRALDEIRGMDTEWLSGMVLQLESLLDDLDDPDGTMQSQLDRFIGSVRDALNRLVLEVRAHRRSLNDSKSPPPPPTEADDAASQPLT